MASGDDRGSNESNGEMNLFGAVARYTEEKTLISWRINDNVLTGFEIVSYVGIVATLNASVITSACIEAAELRLLDREIDTLRE